MVLRVDEHDWTPRINIKVLQGISGNKIVHIEMKILWNI